MDYISELEFKVFRVIEFNNYSENVGTRNNINYVNSSREKSDFPQRAY